MLSPQIASKLQQGGQRLVITGAGGWLGMATLELLSSALGEDFENRVRCFGSRARTLELRDGRTIDQRPLPEIAQLPGEPTLLLHLAFLTKDRAERMDEAEYVRANRLLSAMVLDSLDSIGADGVFVASSGAAGYADRDDAGPAMRLYGSLKREDEESFADWAERSGKRAVVTRIFNLSGPYINKHSSYALACFILDALAGKPIEIHAAHRVVRGYVAIRELMSLVFALLLDGNSGTTRFETGGSAMEMQEIAESVAAICGPVSVLRPAVTAAPADEYAGSDETYRELLLHYGIEAVSFDQQITETARFLGENQQADWMRGKSRDSSVGA